MEKGIEDFYRTEINELTLERKIKLPAKKIKHIVKPIYTREKFKVKIGKFTLHDTLEAQKTDFGLAPDNTEKNLKFLIWMANRLIKNADPYSELNEDKLIDMFCDITILELSAVLKASISEKKKGYLLQEEAEEKSSSKK